MKMNIWLASALIATSSMVTVAHDNGTRVAATSALGSVVGTAIGGTSGATIGAGCWAAEQDRRNRTGRNWWCFRWWCWL